MSSAQAPRTTYLEGKNISSCCSEDLHAHRCAFEVGAMDLGMGVTYLDPGSSQMGKKESIEDTARVLGPHVSASFRGFAEEGRRGSPPSPACRCGNGLTDLWHPTQMLATHPDRSGELQLRHQGQDHSSSWAKRQEQRGPLPSWSLCAKLGMNFVACG